MGQSLKTNSNSGRFVGLERWMLFARATSRGRVTSDLQKGLFPFCRSATKTGIFDRCLYRHEKWFFGLNPKIQPSPATRRGISDDMDASARVGDAPLTEASPVSVNRPVRLRPISFRVSGQRMQSPQWPQQLLRQEKRFDTRQEAMPKLHLRSPSLRWQAKPSLQVQGPSRPDRSC